MLNKFCLIFLLGSVACILVGIVRGIISYRSEFTGKGDALYKKHFVLTPFQVFILCFFGGTVLLFIPIFYYDYFPEGMLFIRFLKSVAVSIYNTMSMFFLNGDFEIVENFVADSDRINYAIGNVYSTYASILFVTAPLVTATFVLSFFKNISSYIRYIFNLSNKIYYISELNEKSLALATNILSESGIRKPLIVFFDVVDKKNEDSSDLIDQAKRLRTICFQKDITEIWLKRRRLQRKFYFIGENEDKNIKQALTLIKHCRDTRYDSASTQFYVFSTTVDSEELLDSVDNGYMKVRRVNENRNLVISTLLDKPIFKKYIEADGLKKVSILIIGAGNYGMELIKAFAWCGQIPGYRISIHVIDKSDEVESKFRAIAPELMDKNCKMEKGEPYYEIKFHSGIDAYSNKFSKILGEIENITTAFVTLGNDELNVDIAVKLRSEYGKLKHRKNYEIPNIYSVVYSTLKTQTLLQNGGLKCMGEYDYEIEFIGDVRTRYSLEVIEQLDLEAVGMEIHLSWLKKEKAKIEKNNEDRAEIDQKIEKSEKAYDKYEYYRRASMATAVYLKVLNKLEISHSDPDYEKEMEHKRWNAFMRAEGYVFDPTHKDHIAKTHYDLKPYDELSQDEKEKDIMSKKAKKKAIDDVSN